MALTQEPKGSGAHINLDVDYVISFRFANTDQTHAEAQFDKLVQALANVGLATEARDGGNASILLFVKAASKQHLAAAVYRARIKDWLHGVRHAAPDKDTQKALASEPLVESERLRILYAMITNTPSEGGAGITPKRGEWKCVESIFPLHDHNYNREWIKKWSSAYTLTSEDLDQIRNRFGEKIAFYFAFLQSYFTFLIFPAALGFSAWLLLGHFSAFYGVASCLWSVVFIEYWKKQEVDLGIRWASRGVTAIQAQRPEFQPEREVRDPVTGETIGVFPAHKRLARQLLQLPFALLASALLGSLIVVCFGIEIFISEVYDGPVKGVLVFLPTGLLIALVPTLTVLLTKFATRLTDYENYETEDAHEAAMTEKIFVLDVITNYLPLCLTAFVYVPFGSIIGPYLDVFSLTARPFAEHEHQLRAPKTGFQINPQRLRSQVIYVAVTGQILGLAMELVVPYLKRQGFRKLKEAQTERAAKRGGAGPVELTDRPEEEAFLARVRREAELDVYDVTTDLRQICVQFGLLSTFSVVWPLAAISFVITDWIQLRTDAIKICVEMQRPIPLRADSIGPWLDNLGFLAWLGSLTTAALVYLFRSDGTGPDGRPSAIHGWALLLTVFLSEHMYVLVRMVVRVALSKIDSASVQKARRERFLVRKRYLEDSGMREPEPEPVPVPGSGMPLAGADDDDIVTRSSLEADARRLADGHAPPPLEEQFWRRQRYWRETVQEGLAIIQRSVALSRKKTQ
ncbi:MAG: hypothetical protein M1826_001539 [Phylliscum demangeonii]|nr:MAG: hypothetical protein M1826_001539 [Phylliscum demangeonii]